MSPWGEFPMSLDNETMLCQRPDWPTLGTAGYSLESKEHDSVPLRRLGGGSDGASDRSHSQGAPGSRTA